MKKRYASGGTIIRIAVSLVLLAIITLKINWGKAIDLVRHSDYLWWIIAMLITVGAVILSAYKWQLVLTSQGVKTPLTKLVSSYFIGLFLNNFLPTSMGGDVFRAYDVASLSGESHKAVASVISERVLATATLAATALAGLIFGFRIAGKFAWLVVAFSAGCAFLVWACLDIRWVGYLARRIPLINTERIRSKLEESREALQAPIRNKGILVNVLLLSFVFQIVVVIVNLAVFKALRIEASFIYLLIFVPIISAVSMLPVSINGLGVQQGASVVLFGAIGLTSTQATAQSLGFLIVVTLVSIPGWFLLILRRAQKEAAI
ncbi:MAG: lysylphosphatidylglycerol synthase transmembrane domain-containing protein [Actinomycetota bacterium]